MSTFRYFPHTEADVKAMLGRIGVEGVDALYDDIPESVKLEGELSLPSAMSEEEVRAFFERLSSRNVPLTVFAGCGALDRYTPSVVPYITQRSEFLTSYTPYQAEISQGTLRYIFEYQSMMCALTGLDVSNACMYDGPTAAAEAARMSIACTKKKTRVLLSKTLLPSVVKVIQTYSRAEGWPISFIDEDEGQTSLRSLAELLLEGDVAGVIVPEINRYGIIEDHGGFADRIHTAGALLVEYCDPSSLCVIKSPAEWGADIAVGDGQSLGVPLSWGGPYVGFMTCRMDFVRKMPGRIVGQTVDSEGRRCFVLTLQAREQHIRREKATSNICSNESLMALWVTVYLSLMGPEGMKRVNDLSYDGAHRLCDLLLSTGKFEKAFDRPFLCEFTLRPKVDVETLQEALLKAGFFGAVSVGDGLVSFCVTERRTREEIDALVKVVEGL